MLAISTKQQSQLISHTAPAVRQTWAYNTIAINVKYDTSGVVSGTTVRALVLGRFSQKNRMKR